MTIAWDGMAFRKWANSMPTAVNLRRECVSFVDETLDRDYCRLIRNIRVDFPN